ncbi:MAG: Ribonuclease Y [candidate division TM6 bacterium GW2011_GWF2_30_66]|nr:MAG: Ribonuclease Y [candidate division TM6 bacterium GW2011_GWF2_30_66]
MVNIILIALGIFGIVIAVFMLIYAKKKLGQANNFLSESQVRWKDIKREIENEKKEAFLKVKDELHKKRQEFELDIKRERVELDRLQSKLNGKYETLEKKEENLDELKRELQQKERTLIRIEDTLRSDEVRLKKMHEDLILKLERLSNMTQEEAKKAILESLEAEVRLANQKLIQKIEDEAKDIAKNKARDIVVSSMQRHVADLVSPHSSGVVHLPSDEMKGRIIGKEGRNVKSLEMATGMEFVIGDTPEVITISGFNPIRREVARRALEKLIADGRINPTRIEETVEQCEKELDEIIEDYGKQAILEFNLQGVHPELVTLLGKLHFRTSYSQNVLVHSKEVAMFCRMIAQELGLNPELALRAGLFHDIGKAISADVEGTHAKIGADVARRCGENPIVVNAIAAHHEDGAFASVYDPIVVIADTISASRPGARRETLSAYLKRLENLEEIANSFEGVKKAYAMQAGREIRVIVEENKLDDDKSRHLANEIVKKIEEKMSFPGQIKVNVIREKRVIEYAK